MHRVLLIEDCELLPGTRYLVSATSEEHLERCLAVIHGNQRYFEGQEQSVYGGGRLMRSSPHSNFVPAADTHHHSPMISLIFAKVFGLAAIVRRSLEFVAVYPECILVCSL